MSDSKKKGKDRKRGKNVELGGKRWEKGKTKENIGKNRRKERYSFEKREKIIQF